MKNIFIENKKNSWFWIFSGLMIILFFLLPFLARDAGMSGDEGFQVKHAESVVDFYATFGEDTTAIHYDPSAWNLPHYGQVLDNFASFVARIFSIEDVMMTRHIINSLCGWFAILLVGLICFKITNSWKVALIGSLLLFLSPRFLGHSFNNLKDMAFATFMLMSIFYMIVYFKSFPNVKKGTVAMLAISFGLAMACRIGGLLVVPYFGLFAFVFFIHKYKMKGFVTKGKSILFGKMVLHGLIILTAGYILALLLWPYGLVSPIDHVVEAFKEQSAFGTALRQLFEGRLQWSDLLPWYYTPKYILMTVPIAVILGFFSYPFIGGWKKENRFNTFMVYFACIFPIFWIIFTNANVYGGWRHAMFAYPPMVVGAGLGFNALIELCKNKYLKIAATALPFLLLIMPLAHIIRNHPYEYVYFNELEGGMKNAYGNYELDYYFHSTREATEWILADAKKNRSEGTDKVNIAAWHTASTSYYIRKDTADFQVNFCRWYERGNSDWDYAVFVVTGMQPEQIKSEHFPPQNTVHTIEVDGKPICLVLKREDKSDLQGFLFKQKNEVDSAEYYLKRALEIDPYNETAMMNIIEMYLQMNRPDDAKPYIDRAVAFLPHAETSNFFLAHYYLMKNEYDEALKATDQIIKDNVKYRGAYLLACNIYLRKNDVKGAEKVLLSMIDVDQLDDQAVQQLILIYKAQGMTDAAAYKKLYKIMAKNYEKRGKKKEAAQYAEMAKRIGF